MLMVSRNADIAIAVAPRNTLREGDDCVRQSATKKVAFTRPYLFRRRCCMSKEPEIGCGGYKGHVRREDVLQR